MLAEEINKLNALLKELPKYGSDYKVNIGKVVTHLPQQFQELFKKKIPVILKSIFPEKDYKIKPAFGQGYVAGTPSISILHKTKPDDNPSPTSGVYLVFLFSPDLKETYFQLAMGVENKSIKDIKADVEEIREKLPIDSYKLLKPINDQKISNKKYKVATIYGNIWNVEDDDYCLKLLNELIKLYGEYLDSDGISEKAISESKKREESAATEAREEKESSKFSIDKVIKAIKETGLIYSDDLIKRYSYSLLTKPFVILSGLSCSGKTQLALSFDLTMV